MKAKAKEAKLNPNPKFPFKEPKFKGKFNGSYFRKRMREIRRG